LSDVISDSVFSRIYRACKDWVDKGRFFERMALLRMLLIKTIEEGWEIGLGPFGKPYWMCCEEELEWGIAISRRRFDCQAKRGSEQCERKRQFPLDFLATPFGRYQKGVREL
jgi:hypothetical protein